VLEAAGSEGAVPAPGRARAARSRFRRGALLWAVAWTAAAVAVALSAWSYADTRGDGTLSYGKARDAVLADGRRDIARLNTVDTDHLDRDLARWLAATTGPLRDTLTRTHASDEAALKLSGTSTTGTVTDAAVTELDTRSGTARLIATVVVRIVPGTGAPVTQHKRFEADLTHTPRGWRLASLTAVPTGGN
jgi:Mce-associated membrane protein